MSDDFETVHGFEDVWRPPVRARPVIRRGLTPSTPRGGEARARLARIVTRAPEVMVKISGRTRDAAHLRAHLDYISRKGGLPLETLDGSQVVGRDEVHDLAVGWGADQLADLRTRTGAPVSHSIVLSMPAGTNEVALRDAARAFAMEVFGPAHDYVFALHTDTPRPHVHLSVASRGRNGERLNPKKADLEDWRQAFAQALRDRGVEAEATPRRARGVTRKAERISVRKLSDRHRTTGGPIPDTVRAAYQEAAKAAYLGDTRLRLWERKLLERQAAIRRTYLDQADVLARSASDQDRRLARRVRDFVVGMPAPDSRRLALARELKGADALDKTLKGERDRQR